MIKGIEGYIIVAYTRSGDFPQRVDYLRDEANGYIRCYRTYEVAVEVADELNLSGSFLYKVEKLNDKWTE